MKLLILGFGVTLVLWLATLLALAWSWQKHREVALEVGSDVREEFRGLTLSQIAWRNVLRRWWGWTLFFTAFFFLLAVTDFPVWQQLGGAFILAAYWGIAGVQRDQAGGDQDSKSRRIHLFGPRRDWVWYRCLAIAEWFCYLGLLIFMSQIIAEVLGAAGGS